MRLTALDQRTAEPMITTRTRSVIPNTRWRSARRRSNEKSAKQIRREFDNPKFVAGVLGKIGARPSDSPPAWMVRAARAGYRESPGDVAIYCTIRDKPFQVNRRWVVLIDNKRGWVPIESLTQVS